MQKNKKLRTLYNKVYTKGEEQHYTELIGKPKGYMTEEVRGVLDEMDWKGKTVLDVGCGTGRAAYEIARKGARSVTGVDYSEAAIHEAKATYRLPNLSYECIDVKKVKGTFDVVVSLGTLEHMDDPFAALGQWKKMLRLGGSIVTTSPNWVNPRGYMLQTLWLLFRAPITLADLHYLTPIEFEQWGKKLGMPLTWCTVDHDWAHGDLLVSDFTRRIPNVLRDARLPRNKKNIDAFVTWIRDHVRAFDHTTPFSGATGIYHFRKKK